MPSRRPWTPEELTHLLSQYPNTPTRLADALREIERLRSTLKVIAVWASVSAKDNEENPILSREFSDIEDKAMAALRGEGE